MCVSFRKKGTHFSGSRVSIGTLEPWNQGVNWNLGAGGFQLTGALVDPNVFGTASAESPHALSARG